MVIAVSGCGKRPGMDNVVPQDPCAVPGGYDQDAPWPTACRCPSRACYSPAVGPVTPEVVWRLDGPEWEHTEGGVTTGNILISAAGTLYVIRNHDELVALSRSGNELWSYTPLPNEYLLWSGPSAIGQDGTLFMHTFTNIFALTPDGQLKWEVEPAVGLFGEISHGEDGTVYTIDGDDSVQAFSPEGEPLWTIPCTWPTDCRTPEHGPGGGLVQSAFTGWDEGYAQQVLWQLDAVGGRSEISTFEASSAVVGAFDVRDNLYIIGRIQAPLGDLTCLYALGPDGAEQWRREYDSGRRVSGPSIGADGRLYIAQTDRGGPAGSTGHLEAFTSGGTLLWDRSIAEELSGRPIIDADGNLYVGATLDGQCTVRSLSPDGNERWRHTCNGDRAAVLGSMDVDGTLYVIDGSGLFALGHATP